MTLSANTNNMSSPFYQTPLAQAERKAKNDLTPTQESFTYPILSEAKSKAVAKKIEDLVEMPFRTQAQELELATLKLEEMGSRYQISQKLVSELKESEQKLKDRLLEKDDKLSDTERALKETEEQKEFHRQRDKRNFDNFIQVTEKLDRKKESLRKTEQELADLKKRYKNLEEFNTAAKRKREKESDEIEQAHKRQRLESDQEKSKLKSQISQSKATATKGDGNLKVQIEKLSADLKIKSSEFDQLQAKYHELNNKSTGEASTLLKKQEELSAVQGKFSDLQRRHDMLKQMYQKSQTNLTKLQTDNTELQTKEHNLKKEAQRLKADKETLNAEVIQLKKHLAEQDKAHQELSSRSALVSEALFMASKILDEANTEVTKHRLNNSSSHQQQPATKQ